MRDALREENKHLEEDPFSKKRLINIDKEINKALVDSMQGENISRGSELIQPLHMEDSHPSRAWSNPNLVVSRQSTIQNDPSKLLINPEDSKISNENDSPNLKDELNTIGCENKLETQNCGLIAETLMKSYFHNSTLHLNYPGNETNNDV